jgi:hypothetical protein
MGWIINREKESAKNYLIPNITSNITNVTAVSNEVHQLIANINHLIGGIPSGTDTRWIGCCQRAHGNLSQASGLLRQGLENAKQLNIMEWVSSGN